YGSAFQVRGAAGRLAAALSSHALKKRIASSGIANRGPLWNPVRCSLFAIRHSLLAPLQFLNLPELEFDRGGAAEDRHRDLHPRTPFVHLLHHAVERRKRS